MFPFLSYNFVATKKVKSMKRKFIAGIILPLFMSIGINSFGQGPGLIISEILPNPAGTDSPFEYVELVATRNIDFSVTPYSVVFCNNGSGTVNGWVSGATNTYGFSITTGTVTQGQIVYVGGSSMAPTGTKIRVIDTGTQPGDGFGTAVTGGVLGNGGTNCDGVAIFDVAIGSITASTIPVDGLFFGTGTGTAVVNAGADGYQLPVNDLYTGGKLQTTSFLAPDAGSTQIITGTGQFNPATGLFTTNRTWGINSIMTDGTSSVSLFFPPATLSFATTHQTVLESAGSATVNIGITTANINPSSVNVTVSALSTGTAITDYVIGSATVSFPGSSTGSLPFTITINEDAIDEQTEYLVLEFSNFVNAQAGTTTRHYLYIKDNERIAPVSTNELSMQLLSSYQNGTEGSNSTEIVAHDIASQRLFVANSVANKLDILNFSNPASITSINTIDLTPYGTINSVATKNGVVALAMQNGSNPQNDGSIVFMDINGTFLSSVTAGAMPDMICFNNAGTKVITANEGEPNNNYTVDPEGSITVVDISGGTALVTQGNVIQISFTSFNGQEAALRAQGIRIFGPGATAAMDFEPEYITVSDDDLTAWVTLQENNAIAKINLTTNTVTNLFPLGLKDHSLLGNGMDVSDQTNAVNIANFPVKGMYLPDALSHMTIGGQTYLFTANEGDAREYTGTPGFIEVFRMNSASVVLDATTFPNGTIQKQSLLSGRLNMTNKTGDTDNDGDLDEIHVFGSRSFSIWNATTGAQVFDSGDDFEMITSSHPTYSTLFNASNTSGAAVSKNRSDDKGPEPEGITTAMINGHSYAFISLERIGGVMSYNIDDPANPVFASYFNNRTFASNGPDRGAEGMVFIPAAESPNGNDILLLANEISSSLTVYQVNNCQDQSNVSIIPSDSTGFCAGDQVTLQTSAQANVTYQWTNNGAPVSGANSTSLNVSTAGNYSLGFVNTTNQCAAATTQIEVTEATLPVVTANSTDLAICEGDNITLTGSGAQTYVWDNGAIDNQSLSLNNTTTFTVIGTDASGCENTDQVSINVNSLPNVVANATDVSVCAGDQITLTGGGASVYTWDNSVANGTAFTPSNQTYTVTGTDANGCENTDQISISVNSLPNVVANATDNSICDGDEVTLFGTGAQNYTWNNGVINFDPFIPTTGSVTYTVTGTDLNGCVETDQITVTVNNLPNPVITNGTGVIQTGFFVTYQWYLNGNGIVGAESQTFDPITDGVYTVVVTDTNGCEAESAPFNYSSLGISQNVLEGKVTIAPNPFSENTTITFETIESGYLNMELYNSIGQKVLSIENKEISAGKYSYQLNAVNDVSGIYILKVEFNNNCFSYRLVELH